MALLVAAGQAPVQAVQVAEELADDRHPDRQADQHQQVRAGARLRGVRDARGEVDQPDRDADPHHDGPDGHQQHQDQGGRRPGRAHQHHRFLHVPRFRCDNRGVYREFAPPPDLAPYVACVWTTVHRGGVIFPDGCVDLVWHGTQLVVAGPATGPVDPSIGGRRARARRALPARRGRDGARPARGRARGRDGAGRRRSGATWVDERVAAGGMPALLEIVRERLRGVAIDPLARAAALGMAAPGRARGRARRGAGRERAPAAPPLRRRRRLRAEDARPRPALPALPGAGAHAATTSPGWR